MPCSINFSLNSLAGIYETCNVGLQLFLKHVHPKLTYSFLEKKKVEGGGETTEIGKKLACSLLQRKEL